MRVFSLVSCMDSFRIIMVLMAHFDLEIHQMNVKTTFLNEYLYKKRLYGTTQRFCHGRKRMYGMPPVEIHLWVKSKSLDSSI